MNFFDCSESPRRRNKILKRRIRLQVHFHKRRRERDSRRDSYTKNTRGNPTPRQYITVQYTWLSLPFLIDLDGNIQVRSISSSLGLLPGIDDVAHHGHLAAAACI
jgi:hypothetical protein